MRVLVTGAGGTIGGALAKMLREAGHDVVAPGRRELDLTNVPDNLHDSLGSADVVYLCAAKSRFIDCEANPDAYRVNVDAQIEIARQYGYAKIIYLSSEAVERALHTNYGMHKALAEMGLRTVCQPVIARLSKVDPWSLAAACLWLSGLAVVKPGVYRWSSWEAAAPRAEFTGYEGSLHPVAEAA